MSNPPTVQTSGKPTSNQPVWTDIEASQPPPLLSGTPIQTVSTHSIQQDASHRTGGRREVPNRPVTRCNPYLVASANSSNSSNSMSIEFLCPSSSSSIPQNQPFIQPLTRTSQSLPNNDDFSISNKMIQSGLCLSTPLSANHITTTSQQEAVISCNVNSSSCSCWRGGIYCLPNESPLVTSLLRFGITDSSQSVSQMGLKRRDSSSSTTMAQNDTSVGGVLSNQSLSIPPHLKHFLAVNELREAIRDLWMTSTLSEIIPENSKIVVVDARLPLHIVIRSLIEYKRAFVVIFCEETGRIVGEFNVNDIVDILIHFWRFLTDGSYAERIGSVLSDYVSPSFRAELLQSGAQFNEIGSSGSSSTELFSKAASTLEGVVSARQEGSIIENGIKTMNNQSAGVTSDPTIADPYSAPSFSYRIDAPSCPPTPWSYMPSPLPNNGLSNQSRWSPNDLRKVIIDSDQIYTSIRSYSSSCSPRTSMSSQGPFTVTQPNGTLFGANSYQVSDRLILAMFLVHHHREVFLPLPSWFSIRLFEDPKMNLSQFRRLRKIIHQRLAQQQESQTDHHDLAQKSSSRFKGQQSSSSSKSRVAFEQSVSIARTPVESFITDDHNQQKFNIKSSNNNHNLHEAKQQNKTSQVLVDDQDVSQSRRSSIEPTPFEPESNLFGNQHENNSTPLRLSCDLNRDDDAPKCHLVPPPWVLSLDFWKRISGPAAMSSLLGIDPNRPPIEASFLLVKERLSQVVVWNDDRSCPLHFLSSYSFLNHIVQHLRGQHPALDLFIRMDLGMGVPGNQVVFVDPSDSLYDVLHVFRKYRWSSLPVIERSTGRLKGFVNKSHILALVARALQTPSAIYRGSLQGATYQTTRIDSPAVVNISSRQLESDLNPADSLYKTVDISGSVDLDDSLEAIFQRHIGFSFKTQIPHHSCSPTPLQKQQSTHSSISIPKPPSSQYSAMSSGNQTPVSQSRSEMKGGQLYPQPPYHPFYPEAYQIASDGDLRRTAITTPDPLEVRREFQYPNVPPNQFGHPGGTINNYSPTFPTRGCSNNSARYNPPTTVLDSSYPTTPLTSVGLPSKVPSSSQQQSLSNAVHPPADRPSPHIPSTTTSGPSPTEILLSSHGIASASSAVLNAILMSPAIIDFDITLRDAIGHILLTDEHRLLLIDPITHKVNLLLSMGDILTFLLGYCCNCKTEQNSNS